MILNYTGNDDIGTDTYHFQCWTPCKIWLRHDLYLRNSATGFHKLLEFCFAEFNKIFRRKTVALLIANCIIIDAYIIQALYFIYHIPLHHITMDDHSILIICLEVWEGPFSFSVKAHCSDFHFFSEP